MSSGSRVDNFRANAPFKRQMTSAGNRRKRVTLQSRYSRFNSTQEDCCSTTSGREKARRSFKHKEVQPTVMKGWILWRALSYIFGWLFRSREDLLKESELKVLQRFTSTSCWSQFIPISNRVEIRTLKFDLGFSKNCPAIVLVHGLASGLAVWAPCFDYLCQKCPVYALDLPGFGRSTRVPFTGNARDVEYQFVSYIEEWRDAVGLENFILVGHGFGGYIATLYAIRYPERTIHLVLCEPWGFTELPFGVVRKIRGVDMQVDNFSYEEQVPWLIRKMNSFLNLIHPLVYIRRLPSLIGRWLVQNILCRGISATYQQDQNMSDVKLLRNNSFGGKSYLWGFEQSYQYMYNCNMLLQTGIEAFRNLSVLFFWARSPLIHRIQDLDSEVPVSFIYGGASAVDHKTGYEVYHLLSQSFVELYMVQDSGHNTFIDNPKKFCDILLTIWGNNAQMHRQVSISSDGGTMDYDDLYWDCAWETLNLSRQNLNCQDDESITNESTDIDNDWEDDSYELVTESAPEKRYFLAPQISTFEQQSPPSSRDAQKSDIQLLGSEGFYSYECTEDQSSF